MMTLTSLIDASHCRLAALTEDDAARPYREGGWSRKQILGHLIDSASNNHQRFVRCIIGGGLTDWPSYQQERWVEVQGYRDLPWTDLVALWAYYNRLLGHILNRMPVEASGFRCRVGGEEMTLAGLAGAYVSHLKHHLKQILG
jgi:hypothetical protein